MTPTHLNLQQYLRAQAYNNLWANYRLLNACSQLSDIDFCAERVGFFPSIKSTLNHNMTVDWFYISALEGNSIGYEAFEPEEPFDNCRDLKIAQLKADRRLVNVCVNIEDAAGDKIITIIRGEKTQREPLDRLLLHLFQHQIHHRGQVHAMLSSTDIKPPQLDEFFCSDPTEQELRKRDFETLGITENLIWD